MTGSRRCPAPTGRLGHLTTLENGTITSSLLASGPAGHTATATGNALTLNTGLDLTPTIAVNAANPTDVIFKVGGLEPGDTGTVTFTDTTGHQDLVDNIASNGNYSTNLSNRTDGTLAYLLSVTTPSGGVITVDPTTTLGEPANVLGGTPQLPNLLSGEDVRPQWELAGVDYAVGLPSGTTLKDPTIAANLPAGVTYIAADHMIEVSANNVDLNGFDFSLHGGINVYIAGSQNTTITNCNFHFCF